MKKTLLALLVALPLSAQTVLPHPEVDVDEACAVTCGSLPPGTVDGAPTYEEAAVIGDLVRSWVRNAVREGRIPVFWNPELAGDLYWMSPPTQDWRPWRPRVTYCSQDFRIMATLPGGGTGMFCAAGAAYPDRIVISLADPANVRALIAWETTNNWLFWRFGLWTGGWADGPLVGEATNWTVATLAATRRGTR